MAVTCAGCGKETRPGKTFCKPCTDAQVVRNRERVLSNRSNGLCECGRPHVQNRIMCIACAARAAVRLLHLPPEEATRAYEARINFDGICQCCGQPAFRPCVDHKGKKFRGIICWHCNIALGHVKDSCKVLLCMVQYLKTSSQECNPS